MVLMLAVAAAAVVIGATLSRKGRLRLDRTGSRPSSVRLRWWPVLVLSVAGQALLALSSPALRGVLAAADCLAVAAWCALNRRARSGLSGLPLLGLGCALNCVVIAANKGMPVSRWALGESGLGRDLDVAKGHLDKHVAMGAGTNLRWLGDVIPVPGLRTVVSAGDVLMLAGIAAASLTAAVLLTPGRTRTATTRPADKTGPAAPAAARSRTRSGATR